MSGGKNPTAELNAEFSDGNHYCQDWLASYSIQKALSYVVPFSIVVVNFISKYVLNKITHLEGY